MRLSKVADSGPSRQRGQVLLMVTFALVAMLGMIGLVTDLGYARFVRWQAQAAADAAAIAAAEATLSAFGPTAPIACGSNAVCQAATSCPSTVPYPPTTNLNNGCLYAQQNGFTAGGAGGHQSVTITSNITSPPPAAAGVSVSYWVTVNASQTIPQLFSAVFGNTTATVTAQATAAVMGNAVNPCIYALDPSANQAFSISNGASVSVDCGIDVDSSSSQALSATGGSSITAAAVNVTGGFSQSGGASISPAPTTGVSPVADPYASVSAPAVSACDFTNWSLGGGKSSTLSSGVYCNGITIGNGSTATFTAGTYILRGGGLNINGGATVTGSGVTFYNTADGYTYDPISISNGATVTLSAPTSGTLSGMLFFQDRTIVSAAANVITGGSTARLTGVLYFPTTSLSYSGGSSSSWTYTTIVADTVTFSGGSYFHSYAVLAGGGGSRFAGIVE